MKRLKICSVAAVVAFIAFAAAIAALCGAAVEHSVFAADDVLVEYDGKIEHIFTHELVFDTAKAFSSSNSLRDCFDKDHLTAAEFKALLSSLYEKNYVLVSLDCVSSGEPVKVPRGKKPLVISFDDMTYDTVNRGCVDRLVIHDGKLCDYTKNAQPQVSRERENVVILEKFIEEHPDFSCCGGRATLCVNGYNGILGYRCTPDSGASEKRQAAEAAACKSLIAELKRLGYTFASHTYYHRYFNGMSTGDVEKDCAAWKRYIEPIVGKTRVLCFPAGEHRAKSEKIGIFRRYGFDTFLCVGDYAGTDYERAQNDVKYMYRLPFDGTALRLYEKRYARFVDTKAIYDSTRFRPFSYKGRYCK